MTKGKVLLIAEDNPGIRDLLSITLSSQEYMVMMASDGDQAWKLIRKYHPTAVLLDVHMPGRSGLELAKGIKRNPALRGTHILMLSGLAGDPDIAAGVQSGAEAYLTKPFSPSQLLTAVREAMGVGA
jgi:DNA-binding response OmpR family regulator